MVAVTQKVTFEICAELIAIEINEVMGTIASSKKARMGSVGTTPVSK